MPESASAPREDRHFSEPPRSPPFAPWRGPTHCLTGETALSVAYLVGPFFLAQREMLSLCRGLLSGPSHHPVWAAAEPRPSDAPRSELERPAEPGRGEERRGQAHGPSQVPHPPPYPPAETRP